jgi:hypothetical protein
VVAQGAVQPTAQEATAHRGSASVESCQQGVTATSSQVAVNLQIAAAGGIEDDAVTLLLDLNALDMGEVGALRLFRRIE